MSRSITQTALREESAQFIGTCGDSATALGKRFLPAFRNDRNGEVEISRLKNGNPAPMHLVTFLPRHWAARTDEAGGVLELRAGIVAGFVRDGAFYTREEAAAKN